MIWIHWTRFVELWYGNVTIDIFQVMWSVHVTISLRVLIQLTKVLIRLSKYWSSIWSKHCDTVPRFRTLVYVHIHSYTLRYINQEPMCSVTIGHNNDGSSVHEEDGRRSDLSYVWTQTDISPKPDWQY